MLLPDLPADARVWLFAADRPLAADEAERLLTGARRVAADWTSHGRAVPAGAALAEGRVLVMAAALPGGVSGCGIDSMTNAVTEAARALGISWTSALDVLYRDAEGAWQAVPRSAFRAMAREGVVTAGTPVLDLTADTLAEARNGLRKPASASWHGRAFPLAASEAA